MLMKMVAPAGRLCEVPWDRVTVPLLIIIWVLEVPSWKPMNAVDKRAMFELPYTCRLTLQAAVS